MTINDSNWQFLHDATGLSLPFNEMYFRYLRGLGYTGTLQDMIAASELGLNPSGLKNPANNASGPWPDGIAPPSGFRWDYLVDFTGQNIEDFSGENIVVLVQI